MTIQCVAVVGAGIMGSGVALDLALNGYDIVLKDLSEKKLMHSRALVKNSFRMAKFSRKDLKEVVFDDIIQRIDFTTAYDRFHEAQLVVENIDENYDLKKRVYSELRDVCGDNTKYAVNTSCIPITRIGALMPFPEKVIGVHFMNPVPLQKMVEVIKGYRTSDETVATVVAFIKSLKKNTVIVNDSPGFVANRISHLYMNEAAFLVQEKVAAPAQIDIIFKQGYGHKMGPLETADLIGIDTVVNSLQILYQDLQDPKFRCCPLLRKMVDAGDLGRKSGKGFYNYQSAEGV